MSELPSERLGYTDITLCIISCEVTTSVSQLGPSFGRNSKISVSDREAHIKALACHIQDRYLDHFDLGVPIQWMVATIVGECFSRGHIIHERYSLEDVPRGPFTSETQFYSLIEALIQHAETFTTIASLFCRTCSSPGAI
ncbi:hypothetical protein AFLA70_35g004500 [Aspergillus flavus AF70]|nr:hypothetical protein AFLA70_35g004500 [Aspergillus flavus AF70]